MNAAVTIPQSPGYLERASRTETVAGADRHFVRATRFDLITTILSWTLCLAILVFFLIDSRNSESGGCVHWSTVPIFLCGVIIGFDLIDWLRGRFDIFDPAGLIGIFGFHWFFLSPLMQIDLNWTMMEQRLQPPDLRAWFGWISTINLVGLLLYRYLRNWFTGRVPKHTSRVWVLDSGRYTIVLPIFLAISFAAQAYIYGVKGGIGGFIQSLGTQSNENAPIALETIFAESFPTLAMMCYALLARRMKALSSWPMIGIALVLFFVLAILFGGLTGSRSATMFSLFIAVGMIHFLIRPISKKMVLAGLVIVFLYAYAYALLYKKGGIQNYESFVSGAATVEDLQKQGRWSTEGLLLSELSRTELQSVVLHQICRPDSDFQPAWGLSYCSTICHLIPEFIWPGRPNYLPAYFGTELMFGQGSFDPYHNSLQYVYGMVAEGMMNFGVLGAPVAFLVWTLVVARSRKWIYTWDSNDVRLLLAPWLTCLCIALFMSDSNNMLVFVCKFAGIPLVVLWLSSDHLSFDRFTRLRFGAWAH